MEDGRAYYDFETTISRDPASPPRHRNKSSPDTTGFCTDDIMLFEFSAMDRFFEGWNTCETDTTW